VFSIQFVAVAWTYPHRGGGVYYDSPASKSIETPASWMGETFPRDSGPSLFFLTKNSPTLLSPRPLPAGSPSLSPILLSATFTYHSRLPRGSSKAAAPRPWLFFSLTAVPCDLRPLPGLFLATSRPPTPFVKNSPIKLPFRYS